MLSKYLSRTTGSHMLGQGALRRNYTPQKLHIYDGGERNSISGIRATVFGGTGSMGSIVASTLGKISSDLVFPVRGW